MSITFVKKAIFATQGPCYDGFHVPTKDERTSIVDVLTALGQRSTSGDGLLLLKIPKAGQRSYSNGRVGFQSSSWYYWSSTCFSGYHAYYFSKSIDTTGNGYGNSIRPFRNIPLVPTSSWTVLYQGSGNTGVFHNQSEGVISLSSDGQTWITIADKNLGATQVYNNGDTLSEDNCGFYYQWGNSYGFPRTGNVTTSYTKVNVSSYGPLNNYNNSTFIISSSIASRTNTDNANLRGGVDGNVNITEKKEVKEIYYAYNTKGHKKTGEMSVSGWTSGGLGIGEDDYHVIAGHYTKSNIYYGTLGDDTIQLNSYDRGIGYIRATQYWDGGKKISFSSQQSPYTLYVDTLTTAYSPPSLSTTSSMTFSSIIWDAVFYNDGLGMVVSTNDGYLRQYSLSTKYSLSTANLIYSKSITGKGLKITRDGKYLYLQTGDYENGGVDIYDFQDKKITTMTKVDTIDFTGYNIHGFAINSNGNIIYIKNWSYSNLEVFSYGLPPTPIKEVYYGSTKIRPGYRTFTVTRTESSNPASFNPVYSDNAKGLTKGSTAFDEFFGYYGCTINRSGRETATVQQTDPGTLDITQLGDISSGDNVMIAFPRRGIKMTRDGSNVTLSITEAPNKEGYQYFAFTRGSDVKDKVYLGCYVGYVVNNYLWSLSSRTPARTYSITAFRNYAHNLGSGFDQVGWYQHEYIKALYMMKYGTPDNQTAIGKGYTYGSSVQNTGATNSIKTATGATSTANTGRIKLFGLEDWRGNLGEFIDGAYGGGGLLRASKDNTNFGTPDLYTSIGSYSTGNVASVYGTNDGMFISRSSGGNSSQYYCGSYNLSGYTISKGSIGGVTGELYGMMTISSSSSGDYYTGSRLMYL